MGASPSDRRETARDPASDADRESTGSVVVDARVRTELPRVLGLFDAVAIVIGSIIGSGIFLKASSVARELHSFGPILTVWIVIGFVTLCGSLTLAELAAMLPRAGGPYVYLREAFGRLPAFLWGWTEFWVVRTGSLGALACATVIYLNQVIRYFNADRPLPSAYQGVVAVGLIALLTVVNRRSTRWGASLQNGTTIVKVGFLGLLIVLPLVLGKVDRANLGTLWPEEVSLDFWRSIGIAAVAVLWPYDGWINIGPMAEEIHKPQRNIPIALAVGITIIVLVYAAANTTYHLVLPMEKVAASEAVASEVFLVLLGRVGAPLAALGVMCSTFGATQSNMLTGPRIYFAMARDNLFPRRLSEVHAVYATPANAVTVQGIWATLLVAAAYTWKDEPIEAFDALTDFVIFGGSLFYALAVAAVFVLRIRRPDLPRPYRTFGYPITPALYLLAFVAALASMLIDKWQQTLAGSVLIVLGVFYYWWRVRAEGNALRQGRTP